MSDENIDLKKVVTELGQGFEAFKETHARELAEMKKGAPDVITVEKLARIDDGLNKLSEVQEHKARLTEIEKKLARPGFGHNGGPDMGAEVKAFNLELKTAARAAGRQTPADLSGEQYDEYKAAFAKAMRQDARTLSGDEFKALSVGSQPDGGYVVPADMSGRMVTRIFETSPMRAYADVVTIGTDALEGLYDINTGVSGGWVSEKASRSETSTPQLGQWRIEAFEQYANPAATQKLLDDAVVDMEAWLAAKTGDIFGRTENAAFVTASGAGKPRGFTAYSTSATADGSRTWGTFEHVLSGASGAFAASNPTDKLYDLIGAFKEGILDAEARWFTRREVVTAIRKFKDGQGNYLWQPSIVVGQPQQILGFPVAIFQDMPALAADSLSLALGNMRRTYTIVQRKGISTLRDPYTNKPYVHFYSTARVGGGAIDFEALKFMKFNS